MAGPKNLTDDRPGFCVRSTANSSQARSPAFDIDGKLNPNNYLNLDIKGMLFITG